MIIELTTFNVAEKKCVLFLLFSACSSFDCYFKRMHLKYESNNFHLQKILLPTYYIIVVGVSTYL